MSAPRKIVWIDDNPGRLSTAKDLGSRFVDVKDKHLAPELKKLLDGASPKLVIIDHVLDKTRDTHPVFLKGSTIAEAIKEKWPSCPVIGVTNADKLKGIDLRTQEAYDALLPFQNFSEYFDRIRGIARGFALLAKTDSDVHILIKRLKPPDGENARLFDALSDDLKASEQDQSAPSRIFHWVEHLMERPGFLLDSFWSATFVGLNENGFGKVSRLFERAKYRGVFSRPGDDRWWKSTLSEKLYKLCKPGLGELSWQAGRRLPSIKKEHFSTCYYCKGEYPETVAYLDETDKERRAMHLKCSVQHPLHKRELYFEDIRMMQGD